MTTLELVVGYLQTLRLHGVQRLPVDPEARGVLRSWMSQAKNGRPRPVAAAEPASSPPPPQPHRSGPEDGLSHREISSFFRSALDEQPSAQTDEEEENIPYFRPGGRTAEEIWTRFERMLPTWQPLRDLGTLRTAAVPGDGCRTADIMFVGDAPNYYDEKAGKPFQGEAGGKLDGMLKAMGLSRQQVYITHLVKFRPALPRQTTNNRPPNEKEILFSLSILELEARLVQPRVIVALGVIAARSLLKLGDLPLAACQQRRGSFCNVPVIVTHHPSYLLRTSDLAERRRLWEEMLRVMEIAGLPISDKQRGYFLKKQEA